MNTLNNLEQLKNRTAIKKIANRLFKSDRHACRYNVNARSCDPNDFFNKKQQNEKISDIGINPTFH